MLTKLRTPGGRCGQRCFSSWKRQACGTVYCEKECLLPQQLARMHRLMSTHLHGVPACFMPAERPHPSWLSPSPKRYSMLVHSDDQL